MKKTKLLFVITILILLLVSCDSKNSKNDTKKNSIPPIVKEDEKEAQNLQLYRYEDFWAKGDDAILAFNMTNNVLRLYKNENDKMVVKRSIKLPHFAFQIAPYKLDNKKYIAVALGYGRGDLSAPLELYLYDENLENGKIIFTAKTDRTQTTFLKQIGNDLYINYFNSKYYTQLEKIFMVSNDTWSHSKIVETRLGTSVDVLQDKILFARPYEDTEDAIKDEVILFDKDMKKIGLPSLRGARSGVLANLDDDEDIEILVGDGWHQNYGKFAKPQFSLIDFNNKTKKYDLKLISNIPGQMSIEKIIPFVANDKKYVLTAGDAYIELYDVKENWKRERIFEKPLTAQTFLDGVFAVFNQKPTIAVFQDGWTLKKL